METRSRVSLVSKPGRRFHFHWLRRALSVAAAVAGMNRGTVKKSAEK